MCVRRIRTGSDVRVSIDAADAVLGARVTEIVPAVDPGSRSFLVRADLPVLEGVQPGMFGRFQFACDTRKVLAVPPGAVQERGQLDIVFIVDKDRARLRLVRTGRRHTNAVEILSGLTAGETIVADPPKSLQDGDPVLPAPAAPPARAEASKP
jgi:multidrug efflux pump subunit AcrA (membrane-fusion protein)